MRVVKNVVDPKNRERLANAKKRIAAKAGTAKGAAAGLGERIDAEIAEYLKYDRLAANCRDETKRNALLAKAARHDAEAQRLIAEWDRRDSARVSNAVKAARDRKRGAANAPKVNRAIEASRKAKCARRNGRGI